MPRKYVRTTNRASTSKEEMLIAVNEIKRGMSIRKVARKRNIDRTTLNRYYKEFSRSGFENESIFQHIGYERTRIKTMIFPFKIKEELALHIQDLDNRFHGLTRIQCRQLAFQLAHRNNLTMPSSWLDSEIAGML